MVCGKCGKEIEDNAVFCPYCGTSVSTNTGTQNVLLDKKVNPKLIGLTILGFLFAPFSWIWYLNLKKTAPQFAKAIIKGAGLFILISITCLIFFIIANFFPNFGEHVPVLSYVVILLIIVGYIIILGLCTYLFPNTFAELKRDIVKSKKKDIIALIIGILLLPIIPNIISGYISSNSPAGKCYVKYDFDGNRHFTVSFDKYNITIDYIFDNYKRSNIVLSEPYKFDVKNKTGELLNYPIRFTISKNILLFSSASGDDFPKNWNFKDRSVNGMYFEIKDKFENYLENHVLQ